MNCDRSNFKPDLESENMNQEEEAQSSGISMEVQGQAADSQSSPDIKPNMSCDSTMTRRKSRSRDEKICRVCGDKALGYNFNAMTCESCKAFFRRNALKKNTPPCLFQGNCKIDVRTRRFCPACRLVRCMDVGMKQDMILDDTEKKARMQKVIQNRRKKQISGGDPGSGDQDQFTTLQALIKEEPLSDSENSAGDSMAATNGGFASFGENGGVMSTLQELSRNSSYFREPKIATQSMDQCDPTQKRTLTEEEVALFEDLGKTYSQTLGELIEGRTVREDSYKNCNDLINHSEEAVRRLIKFIKKLEPFQQLSQEDQIAALKACVLSSILLRSACFYSIERDAWKTSSGEISTSILKKSTGYSEIHAVHTKFCRTVKELIGERHALFALFQIICIFNPDGKGIVSRSLMSNFQDRYLILLKHFLESEFPYTEAHARFAHLMMVMADLKHLNEVHNTILLQINPTEIEPLMLEVLDLK